MIAMRRLAAAPGAMDVTYGMCLEQVNCHSPHDRCQPQADELAE